jgi:hypothetical protein
MIEMNVREDWCKVGGEWIMVYRAVVFDDCDDEIIDQSCAYDDRGEAFEAGRELFELYTSMNVGGSPIVIP